MKSWLRMAEDIAYTIHARPRHIYTYMKTIKIKDPMGSGGLICFTPLKTNIATQNRHDLKGDTLFQSILFWGGVSKLPLANMATPLHNNFSRYFYIHASY